MRTRLLIIAVCCSLALGGLGLTPVSVSADTGTVTFPSADAAKFFCDTVVVPADPTAELSTMKVPVPRVKRSTAFAAAHPNTSQKITVRVRQAFLFNGNVPEYIGETNLTGNATSLFPAFQNQAPVTFSGSAGLVFAFAYVIRWYDTNGTTVVGEQTVGNPVPLAIRTNGGASLSPAKITCAVDLAPQPEVPANTVVTVNTPITLQIRYAHLPEQGGYGGTLLRWDGQIVPVEIVEKNGASIELIKFRIPATTAGVHQAKFERVDGRSATINFTVKPRIKITPAVEARDSTVNVSLRGYGKNETIRVRWKKGSSWVTLATVVTSNSGSRNVSIQVPKFAPDGLAKVRGDGTANAAQTNVFQVAGGPFVAAKPPKKTATPTPSPTATATETPTAVATAEPTEEATLEPTPSPTSIVIEETTPIATSSPDAEPIPTVTAEPVTDATQEPSPEISETTEAGGDPAVTVEATVLGS